MKMMNSRRERMETHRSSSFSFSLSESWSALMSATVGGGGLRAAAASGAAGGGCSACSLPLAVFNCASFSCTSCSRFSTYHLLLLFLFCRSHSITVISKNIKVLIKIERDLSLQKRDALLAQVGLLAQLSSFLLDLPPLGDELRGLLGLLLERGLLLLEPLAQVFHL